MPELPPLTDAGRRVPVRVRTLFLVGVILGLALPTAAGIALQSTSSSWSQTGTVEYAASNGPAVSFSGSFESSTSQPFTDGNTVQLDTTSGSIVLESSGQTEASVDTTDLTGEWTNLSNLGVGDTRLSVAPGNNPRISVEGGTQRLSWREFEVDDGKVDFVYSGTANTQTTVTLTGLEPERSVIAVDADTGEQLGTYDTTDANGEATLSLWNSDHAVLLQSPSVEEKAPFYDNESAAVDNRSWMDDHEDPTIVNVTHYLTRFGTFIVGDSAGQDAGVGPMLTGLVLFGMAGGITSRSRTGAVGGSVLGVLAIAGVYVSGLAPVWLWAVVIFGLGAVASAVMIRLLR